MHNLMRVLAHAGHPEVATHEGGHVVMALAVVGVAAAGAIGAWLVARALRAARRGRASA